MFERLLVPVDLTDRNSRAIEIARDLVQPGGGDVTLLHVIETLDLPYEELEEFYSRLEQRTIEQLDVLAEPLRTAGLSVDQEVVYGRRAEEVLRYAEEHRIDLIVLNSHRVDPQNPGAGWTTMSYQVAILAQCPVLLVKGTEPEEAQRAPVEPTSEDSGG
jgi:universal stress protein A